MKTRIERLAQIESRYQGYADGIEDHNQVADDIQWLIVELTNLQPPLQRMTAAKLKEWIESIGIGVADTTETKIPNTFFVRFANNIEYHPSYIYMLRAIGFSLTTTDTWNRYLVQWKAPYYDTTE